MEPMAPEPTHLLAVGTLGAPAPGPGTRVARTAGQGGGALVLVELWQAFGWFGADGWTADQAAQRWPAITASVWLGISVVHNVANWWAERRHQLPPL